MSTTAPDAAISRLYASAPAPLPFDRSLEMRAFLVRRDHGNLLVYSTPAVAEEVEAIGDLGGMFRQYLSHWHEAGFGCDVIARTFDCPLVCHELDRPDVAASCDVQDTFAERHFVGDDFEVIPIPGHTPGASAFLWDSGRRRFLFSGDTIYLREREWAAAMLPTSDRAQYMESLELIRELEFDVLVPWVASRGGPFYAVTDREDATRRIDEILERLWRGEDG
jgi:glyoxylase-like metal-dependent hydrolase (beta-lactamase superfamily II)